MSNESMKYEEAMKQIEAIVDELENGTPDIDTLCSKLRTAQKLIKMCRDRLTKADEELRNILAED